MAAFRTLDDLKEIRGKRVLVRVDLNVPMQDGHVGDRTRIVRAAPTLKELSRKGARVLLLSHFGRPKGVPRDDLSLAPLASSLGEAVGRPVNFAATTVGDEAAAAVARLGEGDLLLLENTRFLPGEESNDPSLAQSLAELADFYVNDAFSAAHRAHASTVGVAEYLPAFAGRNMQAEIEALERVLEKPRRPVAAVVGGAKISTKIDLLSNLLERVDSLIVGGAMANTFLAAKGRSVGRSLVEPDLTEKAREIIEAARKRRVDLVLPVDAVIAESLKANVATQLVPVGQIPDDLMILDLGPSSVAAIKDRIGSAHTLLWNGPLGAFEVPPFDQATIDAATWAAQRTRSGMLVSVAGGGDTVAALSAAGIEGEFTYVSTAGGAFLEWLEGKSLPGVEALKR